MSFNLSRSPSTRHAGHASSWHLALIPCIAALAVLFLAPLGCSGTAGFHTGDGQVDVASPGTCSAGTSRCEGYVIQVCTPDSAGVLAWKDGQICTFGFQTCEMVGGQATCTDNPNCLDNKKNQDESDVDCGGLACAPCATGKACAADKDCESGACVGQVCMTCKVGTASCEGNNVRICKSDQSAWDVIATCKPLLGEVCDATTKKCIPSTVIGTPKPTGKYFLYTMFEKTVTEFKGGYDVDSYVEKVGDKTINYIYVNNQSHLDVYTVDLLDTDGDKKFEPHQHPKNPDATGPLEKRKLTFVKTYTNVTLGRNSASEIYAAKDRIYFLKIEGSGTTRMSNIYEFIFASGQTKLVVKGTPGLPLAIMGYDVGAKRWIAGYNATTRRVYGYYPNAGGWAVEFDYPNLAGSHMDGLEVVQDPKKKISYVYVSDMTSDFLAQYARDATTGKWVQKNVFEYQETENQAVEGMGFGAFQHFWITSGKYLYEVGGGDLQKFVGPQID
ncbi:MAG: hypothetical protein KAI47_07900 [Deltaproteobacteria bacterium]|nr:hypothetical protein [Deltaproteobacteria bacterium]